jgi:signal transduction histidine kinase
MSEKLKFIIIFLLLLFCVALTVYCHFYLKIDVVFTHLFYIPIVIGAIWWRRVGCIISISFAIFLLTSIGISNCDIQWSDILRSSMFIIVGITVSQVMRHNREMIVKLIEQQKLEEAVNELNAKNRAMDSLNSYLITNKKNIENEAEQLRILNATKEKLFSIIAHDLRSPFNTILGLLDLLQKNFNNYDKEKIKTYIEKINVSANTTYAFIENLLEWAKTQTVNNSVNIELIYVNEVINDVIILLKPIANAKNIELKYNQTVFAIWADKNMLATLIRNLLNNAIKFSYPESEIIIMAKTDEFTADIIITDSGIGMDEDTISKLFSIDTHTIIGTSNEKGSGLGLLICNEIIQKHKGSIEVKSEKGKGSTFIIHLPKNMND